MFEKIKLKNIFFNNINHTNVYYCYLNEIRHKMRNVFIVSAYIKIIYGTIKYVRRAHLIYVINILVSIYAVNLSHRVRVLLKFATVRIRARSERFIFVIIGDCVTQIRAHLSARWKREPRVGPGGFARQKKKNSADETRGQSGWGKKAPRRPFYRDNCTTRAGAHVLISRC